MLLHECWLPFWEEVFRREVADELFQDPSYGDITHPVSYRAFGHDIDSVEPKRNKINCDRSIELRLYSSCPGARDPNAVRPLREMGDETPRIRGMFVSGGSSWCKTKRAIRLYNDFV